MKKHNSLFVYALVIATATCINAACSSSYERYGTSPQNVRIFYSPQEKLAAAYKELKTYQEFISNFSPVFELTPDRLQKINQTLREKSQKISEAQLEMYFSLYFVPRTA